MTLVRILEALLLLSVLVMIHELGHYTAGRLLGFTILEYAIGMGPKVVGFKKNGIEYNLRALPLGGMCRFYGEDDGVKDERCFNAQKPWKRFIVILAGPVMNFVLAFVLAMILLLGWAWRTRPRWWSRASPRTARRRRPALRSGTPLSPWTASPWRASTA